jgi:hypothetical protein
MVIDEIDEARPAPSWGTFALTFGVLFIATQLPLYLVTYPDINEFADHVARIHVLQHLDGDSLLQKFYLVDRALIVPNLAMDALLPPLAALVGAALAVKLYASAATLAMTSGAIALGRAFAGRLSVMHLGVLMFAANSALTNGYLNYLLGLGGAFWLLAAWMRARGPMRLPTLLGYAVAATALYLCHLSAFGIYALGAISWQLRGAIGASAATDGGAPPPPLYAVGQFIPAALIYIASERPTAAASWIDPALSGGWWAVLEHKAMMFLTAPMAGVPANPPWIYVLPLLICAALAAAMWRGALRYRTEALWLAVPLVAAIVMLPYSGFGSSSVDARLLPALLLIVWTGLDLARSTEALRAVVMCLVAAATVGSATDVLIQWRERDPEYGALRVALSELPSGARVAAVIAGASPGARADLSPYFAAWSIVDRGVLLSSFDIVPFHPCWVGFRQPYLAPVRDARTIDPRLPAAPFAALRAQFDYLVVFGSGGAPLPDYAAVPSTVYAGPHVKILATGAAPAR